MANNLEPIVVDEDSYAWFLLETLRKEDAYVEFCVYEVSQWDGETKEPIDAEVYLKGTIKFDGCSHMYFGRDDGYMHLCGKHSWGKHIKLMTYLMENLVPK